MPFSFFHSRRAIWAAGAIVLGLVAVLLWIRPEERTEQDDASRAQHRPESDVADDPLAGGESDPDMQSNQAAKGVGKSTTGLRNPPWLPPLLVKN